MIKSVEENTENVEIGVFECLSKFMVKPNMCNEETIQFTKPTLK